MFRFTSCLVIGVVLLTVGQSMAATVASQWTVEDGGNGHWYEPVASGDGISWGDARAEAIARGGDLATITSAAENVFVYSLVDSREFWDSVDSLGPWLGGYQDPLASDPAENWHWVTGESWDFTSWARSEPNDWGKEEDRLMFYWRKFTTDTPVWNDQDGARRINGFVIEYVPEPSSLALLAMGAVGILAYGWQRWRRRVPVIRAEDGLVCHCLAQAVLSRASKRGRS